MRNKRPLKNYTKKLLRKAEIICEKEMKLAVRRRAENKCEVCGSTYMLQVDHWLSRGNSATYFSVNNLTLLCSTCHGHKTFDHADGREEVTDVVRMREGKQVMDELRAQSRTIKKWQPDELLELAETYKKLWNQ